MLVAENTAQTRPDGSMRIVARSYDTYPWEIVPDNDNPAVNITCLTNGTCAISSTGSYRVRIVDIPAQVSNVTNLEHAARLSMQATFGANKDELIRVATTYGKDFGNWIRDQMRLAPTFTRSYYRQRTNPRVLTQFPGVVVSGETQPCDLDSRWHRFVFELRDRQKLLTVRNDEVSGRFTLYVDGYARGETTSFLGQNFPGTNITAVTFPATMRICNVVEQLNGAVSLSPNSSYTCTLSYPNPQISITAAGAMGAVQVLTSSQASFVAVFGAKNGAYILKTRSVACTNASDAGGNSFIRHGNTTYRFDKRLRMVSNTVENPAAVGTSLTNQCPIVAKSYSTRGTCVRRANCGNNALQFRSAPVTLNDTILRSWYTDTKRYVYYFQGLRLEDPFDVSPCVSGVSRWARASGACPSPTALNSTTRATIAAALAGSSDTNPYVRDITLSGANCFEAPETIGASITSGGECFTHVHPDLYSVRDATRWTEIHDGNQAAMAGGNPNPIMKWAVGGNTYLRFSTTHPMQRWFDRKSNLPLVGRYGDTIDFETLSVDLQTEQMAVRVGALRNLPTGAEGAEACGSPAEVANVPELGNHYYTYVADNFTEVSEVLDSPIGSNEDFSFVINNVHLKAVDQLRQRIAWSLSNIIVMNPVDFEFNSWPDAVLGYYDIFVRNAFGNYLDILRDVSYHPTMGQYLTYLRNTAYAVSRTYPDENYSREIMQLFSIGLWKLNDDATQKKDSKNEPMATYTNDDIVDFARVWTGFELRGWRKNVHDSRYGTGTANGVDPMYIRPVWRDRFPKALLDDGYLGDSFPLCDALPPRSFLREGAVFEYTGDSSIEGDTLDLGTGNAFRRPRFAPTPGSSQLHAALCAARSDGSCTFPLKVTLPATIPCTGAQECGAARVRAVRIVDPIGNATKYYSYVPPACVRLTLFEGNLLRRTTTRAQCADPTAAVAAPVCCNATDLTRAVANYTSECLFSAEVMDFATAQARCQSRGLQVCNSTIRNAASFQVTCADNLYMWTSSPCKTQVQVYQSGQVGLIDPSATQFTILTKTSNNVFRVRWAGGAYPQATGTTCSDPACRVEATPEGDSCICNQTMVNGPVFTTLAALSSVAGPDSVSLVASKLFNGAGKPGLYDAGTYTQCAAAECTALVGVTVWLHKDDNGGLSQKTILELPAFRRGGRPRYLLNFLSTVTIGSFSFRNPPHFNPLQGELNDVGTDYLSDNLWIRSAENEVEALMTHFFEHDNCAPFVAYRLIQQLVTSNPSPRYVRNVVNAFRTGAYENVQFSNKYGDLSATVYAILMDREARSPLIEADPNFGMLRDPIIKLYHLLRALDYKTPINREVGFANLAGRIGVQTMRQPSVFGFYLQEFQPAGPVNDAGLVSPASQIATTPNLLGWLNGVTSFIDLGMSSCDSGLAQGSGARSCGSANTLSRADGEITYTPPSSNPGEIIDDLDLLLTAGRLNETTRAILVREYNANLNTSRNATLALKHVLKLMISSLEYQTNTVNLLTATKRGAPAEVPSQGRRMKAIVVVFENGGFDSFNLIVPHSNCPTKDLYAEYSTVRQGAAINQTNLLTITTPSGTQPCTTFGVHPAMPKIKALYDSGDTAFVANVGAMVEPVTLAQYKARSRRLPPSLFAHNVMQRSIQNLNAQVVSAEGVLGRITQAITEGPQPFKTALFSLSGRVKMVQGKLPVDMISGSGVIRLRGLNVLKNGIGNLTGLETTSAFAETYADALSQSITKTEYLGTLLASTTLNTTFANSGLQQQMAQVAKLIKALSRDTDTERVAFFTERGGFDTHATFNLDPLLSDIDNAVGAFAAEMKLQGRWDDVVVVSISDFARTLTSNGAGTDHAWGGNHFVTGGKVKGGRILGTYPDTLTDDGSLSLGRGRILPSTPFEAIWQGVSEWFGVAPNQIATVLPNAANFPDAQIYTQAELFDP